MKGPTIRRCANGRIAPDLQKADAAAARGNDEREMGYLRAMAGLDPALIMPEKSKPTTKEQGLTRHSIMPEKSKPCMTKEQEWII